MNLTFTARLIFWAGVVALALAVTWGAGKVVRRTVSPSRWLIRDVAFAAVILCLFAPALWLLSWMVFTCSGQKSPGPGMVMPYGLMLTAGLMLILQRDKVESDEPQSQPRLYRRLPPDFDGQVICLKGRDHYVDVVTSAGVFTIRSRLVDAVEEMGLIPGHCTHRSHWVTAASIVGVEKQGGKTFLILCNEDRVPVSRKHRPELEQAGVI